MTAMNPSGALSDDMLETLRVTPPDTGDITDDLSQQGVTSMRSITDQAQIASREPVNEGEVVFPNGRRVKISDLNIDMEYMAGDHTSIFADTARFLKNPIPGAMYVWAKKDDPAALAKVRGHLYRRVELDELKEDIDLPISVIESVTTHKTAGKKEYVAMYDVQLMEVLPEAVKRLYKLPAAQAVMKQAGNVPFRQLSERVKDLTGGRASVEMTRKEVRSPVGE